MSAPSRSRRLRPSVAVLGLLVLGTAACQKSSGPGVGTQGPTGAAGAAVLAEATVLTVPVATKRCDGGEQRACALLARAYLRGEEVPRDLDKGVSLSRTACERGDLLGCAVFGQAELAGFVPGGDRAAGLLRCQQACDGKSGFGCRCVATAYGKGIGVPEDLPAALSFGLRSCEYGDPFGCGVAAAAQMRVDGTWVGTRTRALAEKGCAGGDDWACSIAQASLAFDEGQTLEARKAAAAKLDVLCDTTEAAACVQLAGAHQKGLLGAGDSGERMRFYARKACAKDPKENCSAFASVLLAGDAVPSDLELLGALSQRGCEAKDPVACRYLGHLGRARADLATGLRAFEQACALGDDPACVEAVALGPCRREEWATCREAMTPYCTDKKANGCAALSFLMREGRTGAVDLPGALVYAKRGCERRFGVACVEVAGILGLQKAPGWEDEGQKWLSRGCKDAGYGDACLQLGLAQTDPRNPHADAANASFDDACRYGSIEGCGYQAALALGLLPPFQPKGDAPAAFSRAVRACARGGGVGCWVEGRGLERGVPGRPADARAALSRYRDACLARPPFGCWEGAKLLLAATPADIEGARVLFARGCQEGQNQDSCAELAKLPAAKGTKETKSATGVVGKPKPASKPKP